MGLIVLLAPYETFELQPRRFIFDYPWKLPDPTVWSRVVVWTLYALHQLGIWYLIYSAQQQKLKYVRGLHRVNVKAIALNVFFIIVHVFQTRLTYDGPGRCAGAHRPRCHAYRDLRPHPAGRVEWRRQRCRRAPPCRTR